jgi:plasmid stabilization system protein ParE
LDGIAEYIAVDRPIAARQVVVRVRHAVESLEEHPELGRSGRVSGTRELIVPETRLIVAYRSVKGDVEVLAVVHTAMRWPQDF